MAARADARGGVVLPQTVGRGRLRDRHRGRPSRPDHFQLARRGCRGGGAPVRGRRRRPRCPRHRLATRLLRLVDERGRHRTVTRRALTEGSGPGPCPGTRSRDLASGDSFAGPQAELARDRPQRFGHEGDVLVQVDTEELRALVDVVAVDAGRKRGLLELLAHRPRLERLDPVRADEPARVDESGELVAGEERLLQQRVARQPEMLRMREGAQPLHGRITAAGNKNGALPILAACLLTDEPVTLANVPRIRDVETMVELLVQLGADADWTGANEIRIDASDLVTTEVDSELASRIRASFLLAGPLLARVGRASVPPPGGDVIGRRRLDPHIHALAELGARIEVNGGYQMHTDGLRGRRIFLDEASVMATENAVMAASLAQGETVIGNAACEPHVQDLCRFLRSLGAEIDGIGSNVLTVRGVQRLRGGEWRIACEHIEVASFIGLAAVTGGDVVVEDVVPEDLAPILPSFERLGVHVELDGSTLRVPPGQELVVQDDLGGQIPKIEDGPWPAFPADLTSIALAVATQARGTVLIFEKMFENRLFFVDKLVSMGARIILCDPHRAVVTGPARLFGQRMASPDIRAGMAMLIAGLCAEGTSTIGNVGEIDRGYERIDERLRSLGARIERVEG